MLVFLHPYARGGRFPAIRGVLSLLVAGWAVLGAAIADATDRNPTLWARWPGYQRGAATAVALDGGLAAVVAHPGVVHLWDVSSPSVPRSIAWISLEEDTATQLHLEDGILQVLRADGGVRLIDVRSPAHPRLAGTFQTPASARLAWAPWLVAVGRQGEGVELISVLDPDRPRRVATVPLSVPMGWLGIGGRKLAVVDGQARLWLFDLSQGEMPKPDPRAPLRLEAPFVTARWIGDHLVVVQREGTSAVAHAVELGDPSALHLNPRGLPLSNPPASLSGDGASGGDGWVVEQAEDSRIEIERFAWQPDEGGSTAGRLVRVGDVLQLPMLQVSIARSGPMLMGVSAAGLVRIYDAADPVTLRQTAEISLAGEGLDLALSGESAWIADGSEGVVRLDARDRGHLVEAGRLKLPGRSLKVFPLSSSQALVLRAGNTLTRVDFTDPDSPRAVGESVVVDAFTDGVVQGGILFLDAGLHAYVDARDPVHLVPGTVGQVDGFTPLNMVRGAPEKTSWWTGYPRLPGPMQLAEIDVSDLVHPKLVRTRDLPPSYRPGSDWVAGSSSTLMVGDASGYAIWSVPSGGPFSSAPFQRMPLPSEARILPRVELFEDLFLLRFQSTERSERKQDVLWFCRRSDASPSRVEPVGSAVLPEALDSQSVIKWANGELWIGGPGGISCIRFDLPAGLVRASGAAAFTNESPTLPEWLKGTNRPVDFLHSVALGSRVLVARPVESSSMPGFVVLRPVDGRAGAVEGSALDGVPCHGLAVVAETALVTAGTGGLYAVDVSNPSTPRVAGWVPIPGFATNVVVLGGVAYVATRSGGVAAVDVTDPAAMQVVSRNSAIFASELRITPEGTLLVGDGIAWPGVGPRFSEVQPIRPRVRQLRAFSTGTVGNSVRAVTLEVGGGDPCRLQRTLDGSTWFNWRSLESTDSIQRVEVPVGDGGEQQWFRLAWP